MCHYCLAKHTTKGKLAMYAPLSFLGEGPDKNIRNKYLCVWQRDDYVDMAGKCLKIISV